MAKKKIQKNRERARRGESEETLKNLAIAQAKLLRLMHVIILLSSSKFTLEQLAQKLDQSERTVYRYLNLLETLEFGVEKDFNDRFFIVEGTCPVCGSNHLKDETEEEVHNG